MTGTTPKPEALRLVAQRLFREGKSISEIAREVEAHPSTVGRWLIQAELHTPTPRTRRLPLTDAEREAILAEYLATGEITSIAKQNGVSVRSIYTWREKANVPLSGRIGRRGRLTTEERADIAARYRDGSRAADLATEYGISRPLVYHIVKSGNGGGRRQKPAPLKLRLGFDAEQTAALRQLFGRHAEHVLQQVIAGAISDLLEHPSSRRAVAALAQTGEYTARQLADVFGVSSKAIERHLEEAGVSLRDARRAAQDRRAIEDCASRG